MAHPLFLERPNPVQIKFSPLDKVRILVFPHLETYTAPHGRETILDEVTLLSDYHCEIKTASSTELRSPVNGKTVMRFRIQELNESKTVRCQNPVTVLRETGLRSHTYLGEFLVKAGKSPSGIQSIFIVNHIPFETYLQGVVPAEMPSSWPEEALKAQAVTARTFGYNQILAARQNPVDPDYDIDDTVFYQAYMGLSSHTPQASRAVKKTDGQILLYDGLPIIAYFSADSGGHTESASNVWPIFAPYCVSKPEVYDQELVNSQWTASLTVTEIEEKLKNAGVIDSHHQISKIEVLDSERFGSGRASQVHLHLINQPKRTLLATEFRLHIGLRSTYFSIAEKATGRGGLMYIFKGRGYGHGVGMNQWGAKTLAQSLGWSYQKILNFYYSNVVLKTVRVHK